MAKLIDKIPKPEKKHIKLLKVEKVIIPHPYCITPRHLTGKSMYLNSETIRDAENTNKAVCDICKNLVRNRKQDKILSFDEHTEEKALFLEVPKGDLNKIKGLGKYLTKIKPVLTQLKISGVAFKQV